MSGERDVEHELGRGLGEGHVGALLTGCTDCCTNTNSLDWLIVSYIFNRLIRLRCRVPPIGGWGGVSHPLVQTFFTWCQILEKINTPAVNGFYRVDEA